MIELAPATVLLQWATGGLGFLWVTTRRGEAGPGYGWLLRIIFGLLAGIGIWVGFAGDTVPVREWAAVVLVAGAAGALVVSVVPALPVGRLGRRRGEFPFPAVLDLLAPAAGLVGVVAAGLDAGDPAALALARTLVGTLFLGAVTDAMLLGHWYLVQPGLARGPLLELVRWSGVLWLPELVVMLWPTGMVSVLSGSIDDGYNGLLGWFWVACVVVFIGLVVATRAALRERQYAAVMAATGLLYLGIICAFGMDLVARLLLDTG